MREPCLQTVAGVTLDVRAVDETTRDRAADRDALVALAAEVLGVPATSLRLERRCPHCGGTDHGRPSIPGAPVAVSLARTDGLIALAVAGVEHGAIGVDVERISRVRRAAVDAFSPAELAGIRRLDDPEEADRRRAELWAAKEAILKADGRGLLVDPRTVEVEGHPGVVVRTDGDVVLAVAHDGAVAHDESVAHGGAVAHDGSPRPQSAGTASA